MFCGLMLRTDGIIGTESASSRALRTCSWMRRPTWIRPTEGPFRVRGAGIKQDAVADAGDRMDEFPDGTCRIAAFEGDRRDKEMRKRMQHHVGQAEE